MSETIIEAFDSCDLPPILTGTGSLYIVDGTMLLDCGNFSLVDVIAEAESKRYFDGSDEVASVLGITSLLRIQLSGDTFSPENVSRLVNEPLATAAEGDQVSFRTVRSLPTYHLKFRKRYPIALDCPPTCYFDLDIWRAYLEPNFTWTFSQDEPTVHVFNFIALPDVVAHPNNPFALLTFTCPTGGGESFAQGGGGDDGGPTLGEN